MRAGLRIILMALAAGRLAAPQVPADAPRISRIGTIERGQSVDEALKLRAGEILDARAEQTEGNLALSLQDSAGKELSSADIFTAGHTEHLIVRAPSDDDYSLKLRPAGEPGSGSYRLTVHVRTADNQSRDLAEGFALLAEGERLRRAGNHKASMTSLDRAAARLAGLGAPALEAKAAHLAGNARFFTGDQAGAREWLMKSLDIARRAGLRRQQSDSLETLSRSLLVAGQAQQARDAIEDALALAREMNDRVYQANLVNAQAIVYRETGDPERAWTVLQAAITGLDDRFATTRALLQLTAGGVHIRLRNPATAVEVLQPALEYYRRTNNHQGIGVASNSLGVAYSDWGKPKEAALAFEAALKVQQSTGRFAEAAVTLYNLGGERRKEGRFEDAARILNEALQALRAAGNRDLEAFCLNQMALVDRDRGNLDTALGFAQSAVNLSLATRRGLRTPATRAAYLAARSRLFEVRTDILMGLHAGAPDGGYSQRALEAINDIKARGLFEMIADDNAAPSSGRTAEIEGEINRLERERVAAVTSNPTKAAELGRMVTERIVELENVRRPRDSIHALATPDSSSVDAIRSLLDAETVLLQYGYGTDQIYAWLVTREGLMSFRVEARNKLEPQLRRAHELLAASPVLASEESAAQQAQRPRRASEELDSLLKEISAALIGPVGGRITGKRLIIVPEGVLQYLPFAALPSPARPDRPLVVEHEIVYLPSAVVLRALREMSARRRASADRLALFADPVFRADDVRVRNSRASPAVAETEVTRSARESGVGSFRRLRFSRQEAEAIAAFSPGADTMKALDFAASRQTLLSTDLTRYRVLHFATHGLVNHVHPELSGLVLSLVDEQGQPVEGFLRLHEIFGLRLGADLVVLSACQTALGRELRGEGLAGLSQGFMSAGASRVLASLWNVDDRATAHLMTRFYAAYLNQGHAAGAALRMAQMELRKDARWKSPYYWAGFVLQGDWR